MECLVSVEEAARRLGGISKWTVHAWLSQLFGQETAEILILPGCWTPYSGKTPDIPVQFGFG